MKQELYKTKKLTKRSHAQSDYVSTNNVEILNSFNPELHPKDTKPIFRNKLKD